MINADLADKTSTYNYNGAKQGGAIYCSGCLLSLTSITYNFNEAYDGGTFWINNFKTPTGFTQTGITISNSKAFNNGGTFYVTGTSVQTLDVSTISVAHT